MSDPAPQSVSVFGFPQREIDYHSIWVARAFTVGGVIGHLSGGILAGPALESAMGGSPPPHAVAVVSASLSAALRILGSQVELAFVGIGLVLGLFGLLGWICEPAGPLGSSRFRFLPKRPIRFLGTGMILFLFPGLAHEIADADFARYLWGLGVFSSVSCILVGSTYMAATAGKATFSAVAPAIYAYALAIIVVVCGVSMVQPGPWTLSLLFGLTLPAPGLVLIGVQLGHEIRRRESKLLQDQALETLKFEEEAADRRAAREKEAYERQIKEREHAEKVRQAESTAAQAASAADSDRRQELLRFLNGSP